MDSLEKGPPPGSPDPQDRKEERRFERRLECWGSFWISVLPGETKVLGFPVNLSAGGCCFETDADIPAQIGTNLDVHIRIDGFRLRLAGVITHMKVKTQAGIKFTHINERKAEQIQRLVKKLIKDEQERANGVLAMCKGSDNL